ncbi:TRAP transporter permease [Chloroflexota bacterium]
MTIGKRLDRILLIVGGISVLYHLVMTVHLLTSGREHLNIHLGLALVLIILGTLVEKRKQWPVLLPLLVLALVPIIYMRVFYQELDMRMGFPTDADIIIGVILLIALFEACRRAIGIVIPVIALVFIGYALVGNYLPAGPFHTVKVAPDYLVSALVTSFDGVYGMLLEVSAYYVFLFIIFGMLIQVTGAPTFFAQISSLVARMSRGGPAMMAVVGSAMMGTVSGSASANIVVTGSFTIPLMKKAGFSPTEAGAIESAASNGGQIMPPIMGAVAFVMARLTGISYVVVMGAAFVPALLYFLSAGIYIELTARKRNLQPLDTMKIRFDSKILLRSGAAFLVPLAVIVVLFLRGLSPNFVAFWAIVATFAMGYLRPGKRPSLGEWLKGFTSGARIGAMIAVTLATLGIVLKVINLTGIGVKLPAIVEAWSHGNLVLALVIVAVVSIILGMGGASTTGSYILVAVLGAPVLIRLGVLPIAAHFFVLYFAVMALITPPVATGVIVACRIAGSGYLKTAFEATKVAIVGFLAPFIFVMSPIFLLQGGGELSWNITTVVAGLVMILCAQVGFVNYYFTHLHPGERALFQISFVSLFVYIVVFHHYGVFGAGIVLFILLTLNQARKRRLLRVAAA